MLQAPMPICCSPRAWCPFRAGALIRLVYRTACLVLEGFLSFLKIRDAIFCVAPDYHFYLWRNRNNFPVLQQEMHALDCIVENIDCKLSHNLQPSIIAFLTSSFFSKKVELEEFSILQHSHSTHVPSTHTTPPHPHTPPTNISGIEDWANKGSSRFSLHIK